MKGITYFMFIDLALLELELGLRRNHLVSSKISTHRS